MTTVVGIGCMSGSSGDGLDICSVEFTGDILSDLWGYRILHAEIVPYTDEWQDRLRQASPVSGEELIKLHIEYGHFVGKCISEFIKKYELDNAEFVASHGHTIFHMPDQGYTFQLGSGETTATHLHVPFICDFRTKDVCLGGQAAPLVPCGEQFLFRNNDICINLGGIANIGIKHQDGFIGYDISPCNIVLNRLARKVDPQFHYDKDGELARSGNIIPSVLEKLEALQYYQEIAPKSLWKGYIDQEVLPLLTNNSNYSLRDMLRTATEHIALRVSDACMQAKTSGDIQSIVEPSILITGGGALNKFLIQLIKEKLNDSNFVFETVDENTIKFKEALVFAFLGMRCLIGQENIFKEVTGSSADSVSGSIHRPVLTVPTKHKSLIHM